MSSIPPAALEFLGAIDGQTRDLRARAAQLYNAAAAHRGTEGGHHAALIADALEHHAALIEATTAAAWQQVFGCRPNCPARPMLARASRSVAHLGTPA